MVSEIGNDAHDGGPDLPIRRLYQVVFRHKKKIALVFLLVVFAAGAYAFLAPDSYRSEAKLLVQVGRETVSLDPTAMIGEQTLDPRTTWENELNSELEIAKSDELRRMVVQTIGADEVLRKAASGAEVAQRPPAEPGAMSRGIQGAKRWVAGLAEEWLPATGRPLSEEDRAVLAINSRLDVRLVPDSSVIKIAYEASSPQLAQRVVATLIAHYLDKHLEVHQTHGSLEFFSQETARLERELAQREDELRKLKNEAGVASLEEQRRVLIERAGSLDQEIAESEAAIVSGEARVASFERLLVEGGLPSMVVLQETTRLVTPALDLLHQRLDELRLQERALLQDFAPDSRRVQAVREQIALAEEMLQRDVPSLTEKTEGTNTARQTVFVELVSEQAANAAMRAKVTELRAQRSGIRAQLATLNDQELSFKQMTRRIADLETQYQRQKNNLEQVRVDQALQMEKISNISVLQPATLPLTSERMGKKNILLLGAILGLAAALGLAFVVDFLDQSVRSPEDVLRRLRLPALASIPRTRALRRFRHVAVAPVDEFSILKDRIANGKTSQLGQAIAVTSSHKREGVSTVSANLAITLARRTRQPVLLVDAALHAPSVHRTFRAELSPGLAEKLLDADSNGMQSSDVPNLSVLTAGYTGERAYRGARGVTKHAVFDLFARDFGRLLGEWKRKYRYVVIDLPAVGELSLVPHLASECDGALLVVAADGRRWQVVRHAKDQLDASGAKLLGVVLNKRRYAIPGWLYRTL